MGRLAAGGGATAAVILVANDPRHGTTNGYRCGCRCDQCRAAVRESRRAVRTEKLAWDDPRHGTANGYRYYGCRCYKCRGANRRLTRIDPAKHRAKLQRRRAVEHAAFTVPFTAEQLAGRWAVWGNRCWRCGDKATATDHVKPLTKGGAHILANLRPICKSCNSSKGDQWPYPVFPTINARKGHTFDIPATRGTG